MIDPAFILLGALLFVITMCTIIWHRVGSETEQPAIKFRKGTEIACPKCNKAIATANTDIMQGSEMKSSEWDGIRYQSLPVSDCCGKRYYDSGGLHTSIGWRHST